MRRGAGRAGAVVVSDWTVAAESAAQGRGLVIVRPADNELFVDIDDARDLDVFHQSLGVLGPLVLGYDRAPSPSGRPDRYHIRVRLSRPVKDDRERVALQALLGSDRLHEALSWAAAERGVVGVTVFFEKPASAEETAK